MLNSIYEYLSKFKRKLNMHPIKTMLIICIMLFVMVILNNIVDHYLAWKFIYNTLRGVMAIVTAILIFCTAYGTTHLIGQNTEKRSKLSMLGQYMREELSYKQKVNLSLIILTISLVLVLIFVVPGMRGYTTICSFLFSLWILLLLYVKPNFTDTINLKNNVEDTRDIRQKIKKEKKKKTTPENLEVPNVKDFKFKKKHKKNKDKDGKIVDERER